MFGFGKRQVADEFARQGVADCRGELARLVSVLRQLETEQTVMHDQVRKWMRRAIAAERIVTRNQEPEPHTNGNTPAATATPARRAQAAGTLRLWGARARIAARRAQGAREVLEAPAPEPELAVEEEVLNLDATPEPLAETPAEKG